MTFGSATLLIHLARGLGGFAALGASLATMNTNIWPSIVLLPAALVLLRGCPVCWALGMIETVAIRIHGQADADDASTV